MAELVELRSDAVATIRRSWHELAHPFDLAAVVTVVTVVPAPGRSGLFVVVVLAILGAAVVLLPVVRRSPWTWAGFAAYHVVTYGTGWYRLDNHDALIAYWAVALAIAATVSRRDRLVAAQARYLVGATFLLATGWKILSPQFVSGDFFTFALVVDTRFGGITRLLTGVTAEQVAANGRALATSAGSLAPSPVTLDGAAAVTGLAIALTIATIAVEGAVAVTMLWPARRSTELLRSAVLAAFLVGTYLIVPVSRFGIVLAAMGIAQARTRPRVRVGFAIGAATLFVWGSVWEMLRGLA